MKDKYKNKLKSTDQQINYCQIRDIVFQNVSSLTYKDIIEIELKIKELIEVKGLTYNAPLHKSKYENY